MLQKESMSAIVAGVLVFLGIAVIAGVLFIRSQAQDLTANIDNAAPAISIGTAKLCPGDTTTSNAAISGCADITSLVLTAGTTTDVSFVVQVTDSNGIDDVNDEATGVLYHDTNASPASELCAADNNDCYRRDEECQKVIPTVNSTTAWYRCDYAAQYYTDDSDGTPEWLAYLHVMDAAGAQDDDQTNFDVAKIVSGTFPDVEYGFIDLGFQSSSANNIHVSHQNNGNVLLDYIIALDDDDFNAQLDCSTGGIDNTGIRFDRDISGTPGDLGYSTATKTITVAPTTIEMDIDISQRTNDGAPVGPSSPRSGYSIGGDDVVYSYWSIDVPTSGILGSCQEEIDIIAFEEAGPTPACWLDGENKFTSDLAFIGINQDGNFVDLGNTSGFPGTGGPWADVETGGDGYCGLSQAGSINCWFTEFGMGFPVVGTWVQIESGTYRASCGRDSAGSLDCWGSATYSIVSNTPVTTGYKDITVGYYAACAIDSSDELECWGNDTALQISEMPTGTYKDVACSSRYCTAIALSDGSLTVWGDPLVAHQDVIDDAPVDTGYLTIDAGVSTVAALKADGSLAIWGYDANGAISETPTGVASWSSVNVTNEVACGIIADEGTSGLGDGTLECWGKGPGLHEACI